MRVLMTPAAWAAAVLLASADSRACDTPVYRYAMYRWEPAPYEVYYFHREPIDAAAAELNAAVQAAGNSEQQPANLFFRAVNLAEDTELKTVPPDVRQRWQALEDPQTPSYLIVTPHGVPIYRGSLAAADLVPLVASPARQQIVAQLSQGKAGVLTLLTGSDEAASAEAEKLMREFITDIAAGTVQLYTPPSGGFYAPAEPEAAEPSTAPPLEVGFVKVDRQDPQEKWLVESLLSMEDDLKDPEFADKPMMFAVFGRGRALPPCVGKGINRDNLLDCVDFVTGACSCTVKDQNPGLDLLVAANWQLAAQALAEKVGNEEGNEFQLAAEDFFPDLVIPAAQPAPAGTGVPQMTQAATAVVEAAPDQQGTATVEGTAPAPAGGEPAAVSPAETVDEQTSGTRQAADSAGPINSSELPQVALDEPLKAAPVEELAHAGGTAVDSHASGEAGTAMRSVLVVGAGVGIAFVLLLGVTFLVLRPR